MVYAWLVVIALSLIIEASTAALVAIWFVPSAIIAAVLARLGVKMMLQIVVFLVLSIILILLMRKFLAKKITPEFTPTNADALIGEIGLVETELDSMLSQGVVKVKGQTWSAVSENGEKIEKGKSVEILSIKGVKLIVKERN